MLPIVARTGIRIARAPIMALSVLCSFDAVYAAEFAYGLGYAGEYSSNISRVPANERSEWIDSLFAGFAYNDLTPELLTRVQAIGEYRDYRKDTYEDETLLTFNGLAVWSPFPRQLTWTVEDVYTHVTLNSAAPDTPANRAAANVFSTGPDAYLRFGPVNTLQLGLRYGTVYYGDSDADNDSNTVYARWLYQLSPTTTLSLNYEYLKINNEAPTIYPDYVRRDAFINIYQRLPLSELTLEAGATRIKQEGGEEFDGSRASLVWLVRTGSDSSAGLSYRSTYTDSGADLLGASRGVTATPTPTIPTEPSSLETAISGDFYYDKRAEAFYRYTGPPLGWFISLFQRDIDYELTPNDRKDRGGRLEVSYVATPDLTTTLFAEKTDIKYVQMGSEDQESDIGLMFAYRYTRNILVGFTLHRVTVDSTDPAREFTDNRALLSIMYSSAPNFRLTNRQ